MAFGGALNLFSAIQTVSFIKHRAVLRKYFTEQNDIQNC